MKHVCEALEELHDVCNLAHLDVRLANICPTTEGVKLIDLDRSKPVATLVDNAGLGRYTSVMYKANWAWTVAQVDWKQVGLMVFAYLHGITSH